MQTATNDYQVITKMNRTYNTHYTSRNIIFLPGDIYHRTNAVLCVTSNFDENYIGNLHTLYIIQCVRRLAQFAYIENHTNTIHIRLFSSKQNTSFIVISYDNLRKAWT